MVYLDLRELPHPMETRDGQNERTEGQINEDEETKQAMDGKKLDYRPLEIDFANSTCNHVPSFRRG